MKVPGKLIRPGLHGLVVSKLTRLQVHLEGLVGAGVVVVAVLGVVMFGAGLVVTSFAPSAHMVLTSLGIRFG